MTMRMRCLVAAMSLGAVGVAATPAAAADMYRQPAPYTVQTPLNVYSWAGPYIGAHLGYQWGDVGNSGVEPAGVAGGLQGGFNWQSGQFVFGAEADLTLSGADDRFAAWQFSNPWFGTVRGRVGYAFNNILVYGTAGLAFGDLEANVLGFKESHIAFGWTAGLGLELGLTQNWSVRAEYLYVGLGSNNFGITGRSHDLDSNVFRMGVNYRF